ncbi:cytochrome c oxidase subunit 5B, mitochondrial-like [Macrosteles quadrilineatus]|uniref:cytochrome c oxidase subunit 5B, mitochondrial-like n=1 Tax=Macrosteles quadrilineatus TaxID=74068 RepID=UPI0023E14149|nr:cytochrome c oxidase subunit 5B, mitochondrial-like [Macrosteles quadrilineatus]
MASLTLCGRLLSRCASRTTIPLRNISKTSTKFEKLLDDPLNVATGLEKRELLAQTAGNENPFDLKVLKKEKGTKDCPTEIPSAFDSRIIGCICDDDAPAISWMWLHAGHPKRCMCGHWFKLSYKPPV